MWNRIKVKWYGYKESTRLTVIYFTIMAVGTGLMIHGLTTLAVALGEVVINAR